MKRLLYILTLTALMFTSVHSLSFAQESGTGTPSEGNKDRENKIESTAGMDILAGPPAHFKKASELTKLPEFVPGLGMLYVDPAMMPMGPYLGYDKDNKLLNVIYMVPLKQLDDHKNFSNLGASFGKPAIDHTDILFNAGHAGLEEPHYQIIEWVVSNDEAEKRTK